MANKFVNHKDQKGFLNMSKKWGNKGVPRNTLAEGATKTKISDTRTQFRAK